MEYLIGFDAGTTSFKAVLCSEKGKVISTAKQEYSLLTSGNRVEFPPEEYWKIFCSVIGELFSRTDILPQSVAALSISSQGETLICVDESGEPIGNAIVWLDNRASEECDVINGKFSPEQIYRHTGQYEVVPTWTATKIMWLRKHEPERFNRTHKFLLLEDFLLYRLTGRFVCERALTASTLLYDIPSGKWWDEMLDLAGITDMNLPEILDSATVAGFITKKASSQSGLSSSTKAVTGALDQIAAMIGASSTNAGQITEVTGSCLVVQTVSSKFPEYHPAVPITCQPFCSPGKYLLLMFSNTAGMAFKWFRDKFFPDGSIDYVTLAQEASGISPGADGLMMFPHLAGAQFPNHNPNARGSFIGITLAHGRGHFVRAILESVAFIQRNMLDSFIQAGYPLNEIIALGGGASNKLWLQIKADVNNKKITTIKEAEPAAVGAAALAGVGCGIFESIEAAGKMIAQADTIYLPDNDNSLVYQDLYRHYRALDKRYYAKSNK